MWSRLGNHDTCSLWPYGWASDPGRVSLSPAPLLYAWKLKEQSSFFWACCGKPPALVWGTPRPRPAPNSDGEILFEVWLPHSKATELNGRWSLWHGLGHWSELHPWPPQVNEDNKLHLAQASENRQIQVDMKVLLLWLFGDIRELALEVWGGWTEEQADTGFWALIMPTYQAGSFHWYVAT